MPSRQFRSRGVDGADQVWGRTEEGAGVHLPSRKGTHRQTREGLIINPKKKIAKKRNPKETDRNGPLLVLLSSLVQCGIQCGSNTRW